MKIEHEHHMAEYLETYRVTVYQEYYPEYLVQARSEEEAINAVMDGEGKFDMAETQFHEVIKCEVNEVENEST